MLEINQIHQGNSAELLKKIDDSAIDLTVTSPPYDNLRDYKGYSFDFETIAEELYRITKDGSMVVWIVGDATVNGDESGTSFKQALYFKEIGFKLHDTMIYEKSGFPFPQNNRYYQAFEYMFVFVKGKPKIINLIRDKKNKYYGSKIARKRGARQKDGSTTENPANKLDKNRIINMMGVRYNIWRPISSASKGDKIALLHPASFPEKLAEGHILSWSNKGNVILDPMCGSGTTCIAAEKLNRKWIGIEISSDYCEIAENRLKPWINQTRLSVFKEQKN